MDKFVLLLKSVLLQALFAKDDMQRSGFRSMTKGAFDEYINTNPFFITVLAGIIKSNPRFIQKVRFIGPISAMLGDDLFWNLLKPVTLYSSLILFLLFRNWILIIPLIMYNIVTFLLRYKGYDYGISKAGQIKNLYNEWYFKKVQKSLHKAKVFLFGILSVFLAFLLIHYLQKHILYAIIISLILTLTLILKSRAFFIIGIILTLISLAKL